MDELQSSAVSELHPQLHRAEKVGTLAELWAARHALRIDGILTPGLAAELSMQLARIPFAIVDDGDAAVTWRCQVTIPTEVDPQHPECLYRVARFLARDLPALATALTGASLKTVAPYRLDVVLLRKGSYIDSLPSRAPVGGMEFWIGLTGAEWPASSGGHWEFLDACGGVTERHAPGWDTLDLLEGIRYRRPLIVRPVECLAVRGILVPREAR